MSTACTRVAPLLFAYADAELEAGERELVEAHVVACKSCGMRLSRIELELLRLKEVLVPMEPPAKFTQGVMDRVRDVVASEGRERPPSEFTRDVMSRVRAEAGVPPKPVLLGRKRAAIAALVAGIAIIAWYSSFVFSRRAGPDVARGDWTVSRVDGVQALRSGQRLDSPYRLAFESGTAMLDARGADPEGSQWSLEITGPARGELLGRGRMRLDAGEVRVETGVADSPAPRFVIDLGGGQELRLARGDFGVTAHLVDVDALMGPRVARYGVWVAAGRAELVAAEGGATTQLSAGQLAWIEPLQPLRVVALPSATGFGPDYAGRRVRDNDPAARAGTLVVRGSIRDPEWRPIAGAAVRLHAGQGSEETVEGRSGADGRYELHLPWRGAAPRSPWLSVAAPASRPDLARVDFEPLREPSLQFIQLERLRPVRGRVLAANGTPLRSARVRAVRFDAFLGTSRVLRGAEATTDGSGRFALAGWQRERRGETTALLVEDRAGHEPPHVAYGVGNRAGTEIRVRLEPSTLVELRIQDPRTRRVWVEKRPAGPAADLLRAFEERVVEPGVRKLVVRVRGSGTMRRWPVRWWEDAGTGKPAFGHEGRIASRTATSGVALLELPARRIESGGSDPRTALPGFLGVAAGRWSPLGRDAEPGGARVELTVLDAALGRPLAGARVFVRAEPGAPHLAGISDSQGRVTVTGLWRGAPIEALAVEPRSGGGVGVLRVAAETELTRATLELRPVTSLSGRVDVAPRLGQTFVELKVVDGPFAGFTTAVLVGADGRVQSGDVPPGSVRVRLGDHECEVDAAGGQLELPPFDSWK